MIHIDYRDDRPIYKQICDSFEGLIGKGILKTDDQLPSVRQLALDLSINPNTIQRSYQDLENRGIIYSVKGKGSFVSAEKHDVNKLSLKKMIDDLKDVINNAKRNGVSNDKIAMALEEISAEVKGGAER